MPAYKSQDISKSLCKKGFLEDVSSKQQHHKYYYLYVNGKKQNIYTYVSHDTKIEYSSSNGSLFSAVKKQLKFSDKNKLCEFIDCTFSESDYISMLSEKGFSFD